LKPAIFTFASTGVETARRIATLTGGTLHDGDKTALVRAFAEGTPIIGICAAGILIRLLAPHLGDKHDEPPVLAVSQDGGQIVPLLGGHHGANRLARQIAEGLGGLAVLTTASDARFATGLDEPPAGYVFANPSAAKPAMAALLGGAEIALTGNANWLAEAGYPLSANGTVKVVVTEKHSDADALVFHPKTIVAGVGCERGADAGEVIDLITATLDQAGLSPLSLAAIGTVDLKADEAALHAAARHFDVPLRVFSVDQLNAVRTRLANPSAIVEAEIGTPGVSEAAALQAGDLIVEKQKSRRATCAIGKSASLLDIDTFGRAPGLLHIVGIGPGEAISRTQSSVSALDASADWVGYGLYLDLIEDLHAGQTEHRFPLGDEELRVRHALELAGTGKTVSLVCSGDAQIYAMAALVYELLDAVGTRAVTDPARRVGVQSHPGISAFQAASSKVGALIGHDFCCISLSDLLTPREDILKRLEGAAQADFVTAFYNPRSLRRTDLIEKAQAIFLAHRPPETPVIIGSSLGRPEEKIRVVTLASFDPTEIDMLTIVLFGSSTSKAFTRGDGRTVAFTPRGYAKKAAQPILAETKP